MSAIDKSDAKLLPLEKDGKVDESSKKFIDKNSQKMIDKIRKEHSLALISNKNKEYNPKVDQQRVWSERSPQGFEIPFQSLGEGTHVEHPQLKTSPKKVPINKK